MSRRKRKSRRRGSKYQVTLQSPRGVLSPRVQTVGPQHFGIVSIDCHKGTSDWMLVDFYGNVLIPASNLTHDRVGFDLAIVRLREAIEQHQLKDPGRRRRANRQLSFTGETCLSDGGF